MSNLTPLQQKLVDDLIKEFTKINPKPTTNGTKRFGFNTIAECNHEEERFLNTIKKHNQTMVKVFEKQLADDMKAFTKEFGKAFELKMGYIYPNGNGTTQHGYGDFIETNKNGNPQNCYNHKELYLFVVSKTKHYNGSESRYNYFGKQYTQLYVDFKREKVAIKLDSGKEVYGWKISGLMFKSHEYLYHDRSGFISVPTLDEYVQTSKDLQRRIVEMAS